MGISLGMLKGRDGKLYEYHGEDLHLGPQYLFVLLRESYGKYHWEDGSMGIFNGNCDWEVMILCESQSLSCLLKGSETGV